MKARIEIRMMTPEDVPAIYDMICKLAAYHGDAPTLSHETLTRDATGKGRWVTVLVVEYNGEKVGYVALCPSITLQFAGRGIDIHHLFVEETHRGKGIGRRLSQAALEYAKDQACQYVTVGTHPSNTQAQQIYTMLGFETMPPTGPRFRLIL